MHLAKVKNRVEEVQDKLQSLGFPRVTISSVEVTKLAPRVSGLANLRHNTIKISADYLSEFETQVIERTVPHEVCHLYVKEYYPRAKQYHGPEFRKLMRLLGCDESTRHSMRLSSIDEKKQRKVTRHVYITNTTKKELKVSTQMHNKIKRNPYYYSYKGENLSYVRSIVL